MPSVRRTVKYKVEFVCYQRNGGGHITNGSQVCEKLFDWNQLECAKDFADQVKKFAKKTDGTIPEGSNKFASAYVWDGYVVEYLGLIRITEESID